MSEPETTGDFTDLDAEHLTPVEEARVKAAVALGKLQEAEAAPKTVETVQPSADELAAATHAAVQEQHRQDLSAEQAEVGALRQPDPLANADLDRTKPYGEVHGDAKKRYFQDGKYFDNRGKVITEEGA